MNSRNKGNSGEREAARLLKSLFEINFERNLQQTRGGGFDLILSEKQECSEKTVGFFSTLAIEVKRSKRITHSLVNAYWEQAVAQSGDSLIPIVMMREDRAVWNFIVPMSMVNPVMTNEGGKERVRLDVSGFNAMVNFRLSTLARRR